MPRNPRHFLSGATYHAYCRVARGEFVFEDDFALRFEQAAGILFRELESRSRSKNQVRGQVEFATLAISRYGYRIPNRCQALGS